MNGPDDQEVAPLRGPVTDESAMLQMKITQKIREKLRAVPPRVNTKPREAEGPMLDLRFTGAAPPVAEGQFDDASSGEDEGDGGDGWQKEHAQANGVQDASPKAIEEMSQNVGSMGAHTFSRYNLFYRLERHLLLHQRGAPAKKQDSAAPSGAEAKQFEALDLPPLPARYDGLDMPKLWFLSSKGSDKKRSHRKSHGVASFSEIARIVASNWKSIDPETMDYVTAVSSMLKAHAEKHGIISTSTARPKKRKSITLKTSNNGTDAEETSTDDCKVPKPKEKILSTSSLLPLPSLPMIIPNSIPMDIDGRSKTPRANNSYDEGPGFEFATLAAAAAVPYEGSDHATASALNHARYNTDYHSTEHLQAQLVASEIRAFSYSDHQQLHQQPGLYPQLVRFMSQQGLSGSMPSAMGYAHPGGSLLDPRALPMCLAVMNQRATCQVPSHPTEKRGSAASAEEMGGNGSSPLGQTNDKPALGAESRGMMQRGTTRSTHGAESVRKERNNTGAVGNGETKRKNKKFDQRLNELRAYEAQHGHVNVQLREDKSLALFCKAVRHSRRYPEKATKALTDGRIRELDALGFDWSPRRHCKSSHERSREMAAAASASAGIGASTGAGDEGAEAAEPRTAGKDGDPSPGGDTMDRETKAFAKSNAHGHSFGQRLEQLKAYKAKHEHVNVKHNEDGSLAKFCQNARNQRRNPRRGVMKLTEERIAALDVLGFEENKPWTFQEMSYGERLLSLKAVDFAPRQYVKSFDERLEQLKAHKAKHGHLKVKYSENRMLAKFCCGIRRERRNPDTGKMNLTEERIGALDALGFDWAALQEKKSFEERLEELKAYKAKHGHLHVKKSEDKGLAQFCYEARCEHNRPRKGRTKWIKLTDERIASLDALGFDWEARRENKSCKEVVSK